MSTTPVRGTREQILHATSVEAAESVFGQLKGYPPAHINRCKAALARCKARLSAPPVAKAEEPVKPKKGKTK